MTAYSYTALCSDLVYPPTAYNGRFLQCLFAVGADRLKLIIPVLPELISLQLVLKPCDLKMPLLVRTGL